MPSSNESPDVILPEDYGDPCPIVNKLQEIDRILNEDLVVPIACNSLGKDLSKQSSANNVSDSSLKIIHAEEDTLYGKQNEDVAVPIDFNTTSKDLSEQSSANNACDSLKINHAEHDVFYGKGRAKCRTCSNTTVCPECLYPIGDSMRSHFNSGDQDYDCELCGLILYSPCAYAAHERMHFQSPPHVCPNCGFLYTSQKGDFFTRHLILCGQFFRENCFNCRFCPKTLLAGKRAFAQHASHHISSKFICRKCKLEFKSRPEILMHIRKRHNVHYLSKAFFVTQKYYCDFCSMPLVGSFIRHMTTHCREIRPKSCYVCLCNRVFLNSRGFILHGGSCKYPKEIPPNWDKYLSPLSKKATKKKISAIKIEANERLNKEWQLVPDIIFEPLAHPCLNICGEVEVDGVYDAIEKTVELDYPSVTPDHDYFKTQDIPSVVESEMKKRCSSQGNTPSILPPNFTSKPPIAVCPFCSFKFFSPIYKEFLYHMKYIHPNGILPFKSSTPTEQDDSLPKLKMENKNLTLGDENMIQLYRKKMPSSTSIEDNVHLKTTTNLDFISNERSSKESQLAIIGRKSLQSRLENPYFSIVKHSPKIQVRKDLQSSSEPPNYVLSIKEKDKKKSSFEEFNAPPYVVISKKERDKQKSNNELVNATPYFVIARKKQDGKKPGDEEINKENDGSLLIVSHEDKPLPYKKAVQQLANNTDITVMSMPTERPLLRKKNNTDTTVMSIPLLRKKNVTMENKPENLESGGSVDITDDKLTPKIEKEEIILNETPPKKEHEVWDKFYENLKIVESKSSSKEEIDLVKAKTDELLQTFGSRRTVKKPKRLIDEIVLDSDDVPLKKKEKTESISPKAKTKKFVDLNPKKTPRESEPVEKEMSPVKVNRELSFLNNNFNNENFSNKRKRKLSSKIAFNIRMNDDVQLDFSSGQFVNRKSPADDKKMVCAVCSYTCREKDKFRAHLLSHRTDSDSFQCMECGECYVVGQSLKLHLYVYHKINDTDKYLSENNCYNLSRKTEKEECVEELKENQCKVCKVVFSSGGELSKHFRIHGMAFLKQTTKSS